MKHGALLAKKKTLCSYIVVLIVVIAIVLVVDLVNTLFLCITGQPDWTLVDLCPKFSSKTFGIYHQSSVLFVDIIFFFSFFSSFSFQRRPTHRGTLPPHKGEEVDLLTEICPQSYIFHLGRLCARARACVRVCVCVCVCVCVFHNEKKSARRIASTASDTNDTSSKQ